MKQLFTIISFFLISLGATSQVSITLKTPQTTGGTETACQTISLLPGFSFKATSTSGGLTLRVNPSTCDPYAGQVSSVSASQNYIQTKTYTADDGSRYMEAIQYFDGLGRPVQTVQRGVTPQAADLVTYQEYDPFGREDRSWLPAVAAGNNGAYMPLANYKANAMATYRSTTYNAASNSVAYSRPVYEASPLNRVLEQYAPGADWHKNGKGVKTDYKTNIAGNATLNCILYIAGGTNQSPTLTKSGNYATGQLYVTEVKDEDGHASYEFKDKLGQIVLTRQMEGSTAHDTYYVYNDFDNLCFVLPPRINDEGIAQAKLDQLGYQYKYDDRNRCIWKRLPGCEPIYYVYDKADRLIFTQDGEQRAKQPTPEWTFNKYDAFGRLIISGIYPSSASHASLITKCKDIVVTEKPGGYYEYTWNSLPEISYTGTLLLNYYDNYYDYFNATLREKLKFVKKEGFPDRYIHSGMGEGTPKGLLIGTRIKTLQPDGSLGEIASKIYYDNRGRVIQVKSTNHLGGIDEEHIAYNFTDQPTKKMHIHTKDANGEGKQTEVYTYTYDHAGRLLTTTHQLTDGTTARPQVTLADNTYDELGRLKYNQKGGLASSKTTYGYNIRSWTKSIVNPLFSLTLYYNDKVTAHSYSDYESAYNGNISGMEWQLQGESKRSYRFKYDNLSRLLHAAYNGVTSGGMYNTSYSYDKHGNITGLNRVGKTGATTYGLIDKLTMDYTGTGNQLKSVSDEAANILISESSDFKDKVSPAGTVEYTYNANGAMKSDLNKGITQIQYNSLNLPRAIEIANSSVSGRIKYTYSAGGVKLRTIHETDMNVQNATVMAVAPFSTETTSTETTDYVGNIIYKDNVLNRILVDGGYIEGGVYHYYMTDHLGNNRVVVNASGTITQRNHYYPFGTAFAEKYDDGKNQPYKYNGKELDQMHGLNLYDYSARYYESAIGRFTSIDPHAENYYSWSPYVYVGNNPLKYIDPTGMDWYLNEQTGETYYNSKITDNTTSYKDQTYTRIGDNNMFGDMGKTSEQYNNYNQSVALANDNGYNINPIQQVVHEKSSEQIYKTGPKNDVSITTGETTIVNEKYAISPLEAKVQQQAKKSDILEVKGMEIKEILVNLVFNKKSSESVVRRYSQYRTETKGDKTRNIIQSAADVGNAVARGAHDYTNTKVYTSWNSYNAVTNGKGVLLKFKK